MSRHLSIRTANPALQSDTFKKSMSGSLASDGIMTINGVVNKSGLSLLLLIISASITWSNPALSWLGMVGTIAGLILAVVTIFKPTISHLTVPAYAIMQGLFLGLISRVFENQYPGIAVQAIFLTFGTLGSLLLAYTSGLIKATENFKLGIFGIALYINSILELLMLVFFNISFKLDFETEITLVAFDKIQLPICFLEPPIIAP